MNIFVSDPIVGFTYKPNALAYEKGREYNALYQINSLGLRDRDYGPKVDSVFRVLLVGDSFSVSHGLPIEDSLSRQMGRALQVIADSSGLPLKFEIINSAAGGYSPYNYWKAYRRWAPVFKPDAVLVGLSPDDYDCSNEDAGYLIEEGSTLAIFKKGEKPKVTGGNTLTKMRKWLSWNSEFYVLMRNFFYYNDFVGSITLWMRTRKSPQNEQLQQYVVPMPQNTRMAWMKALNYLRKLRQETKAAGIPLIVVPIPLKFEIDAKQYLQDITVNGLVQQQIDRDQVLRMVEEFCEKEGIAVLDPRSAMRKRQAEVPCYFQYDGHWVAEGIGVATVSLASQWRDSKLPPFSGFQLNTKREDKMVHNQSAR